jgi:hypothetical protein
LEVIASICYSEAHVERNAWVFHEEVLELARISIGSLNHDEFAILRGADVEELEVERDVTLLEGHRHVGRAVLSQDVVDDISAERIVGGVASLEEVRVVRESGVRHVGLVILPVDEVLRPILPLLLSVRLSVRGVIRNGLSREAWVSDVRSLQGEHVGETAAWCERLLKLDEGRGIGESSVGHIGLVVFPVNEVLGPLLPLLLGLSSNGRLRRHAGSTKIGSSLLRGELVGETAASSHRLGGLSESRSVRESSVGYFNLIVEPVDVILSPLLPLLLTARFGKRLVACRLGGEARALLTGEIEHDDTCSVRHGFLDESLMVFLGKFVASLPVLGLASVPLSHLEGISNFLLVAHADSEAVTHLSVRAPLCNVNVKEAWLNSTGNVGVPDAESFSDLINIIDHAFSEGSGVVLRVAERIRMVLMLSLGQVELERIQTVDQIGISHVDSEAERLVVTHTLSERLLVRVSALDNGDGFGGPTHVVHGDLLILDGSIVLLKVGDVGLKHGSLLFHGGKLGRLTKESNLDVQILVVVLAFHFDSLDGNTKQ